MAATRTRAVGLADIERLAAMTLDAGVQAEVEWLGSREPLPADIDLSAFRIIQEAVTNVVRQGARGSPRSTRMTTSTARCGPGRAGSWSRTWHWRTS